MLRHAPQSAIHRQQKENEKKTDAEEEPEKPLDKKSKKIDEEKPARSNCKIQSTIRTPLTGNPRLPLKPSLWNEEVSEDENPDDPTTEWVDLTYVVEEFMCPTCGLRLFGTKETRASGLPEEFTQSEAREREFGEEYNNE